MNEQDEVEEQYSLMNKDFNEEKLLTTLEQVEQDYRNKGKLISVLFLLELLYIYVYIYKRF